MNSITNVVRVKYGPDDEPKPVFGCPVVVDPKVLNVLQNTGYGIGRIVDDAANAVDLVGRFEKASLYVDFAPQLALSAGPVPVAMRVEMVKGRRGSVARIDLVSTVRGLH